MSDRHLCKAKRTDNGEWVEGYVSRPCCRDTEKGVVSYYFNALDKIGFVSGCTVSADTIGHCTELTDKNSKPIYVNDITKLVLPDGEVRYFKVSFKKVIREVLCHPDFDDDVAKVELNAVCFEWNGYELFPCVDENGVSDVSKMEVVGNIFDNPELLENSKCSDCVCSSCFPRQECCSECEGNLLGCEEYKSDNPSLLEGGAE